MRCYIPASEWSAGGLIARDDEAHHLIHVLRVKPGQPVEAFDGAGRSAQTEIDTIQKHRVELRVLQQFEHPRPPVTITLIQAVPREHKMDLVIQKAVELGATGIIPLLTRHSVPRIDKGRGEAKQVRWDKIAINAARQCGSMWLPEIAPVRPFHDFLGDIPHFDLLLTCSLEPDAMPFKQVVDAARGSDPKNIAFLVGPEGDLNQEERAAIRQAGARPVTFGSLILRSETAAIYALSILKYEFT